MLQAIINFFKKLFTTPEPRQSPTNTVSKQIKTPIETKKETISTEKHYKTKRLLTHTEIRFFNAIQQAMNENYILLPQINLASIIERTDDHKYQNELYRNIDFAIFDKFYNPILLIEINDKSHNEKKRIARDIKVKEICQSAGLPLITFWTDYGINQDYINKRISEYLK